MSKYQLQKSSIYYPDTDVPVNKIGIKDREKVHLIEKNLLDSSKEYIDASIQCVQFADASDMEHTILNGLQKI